MATALFISLAELKRDTALSGNIDANKLLPALSTAQELEIEPLLGTDLYDKISADIVAGTLSGDYLTLKQKYIHPVLIHFAVSYYLPYASYIISNGGISKWDGGENHTSLDTKDLTILMNKEKSLAENFKKRLLDHLCHNTDSYPEYSTNEGEDINPTKTTDTSGWYMGNVVTETNEWDCDDC